MPLNPNREYNLETSTFVNKLVTIILDNEKVYTGILRGMEEGTSNVILKDAKCDDTIYHRVFLNGKNIVELTLAEAPFNLQGLVTELNKMFQPQNVKVIEDAGIIQVFDRFTVSEDGVKGTGPIAERIQKIYDKYIAKQGESKSE